MSDLTKTDFQMQKIRFHQEINLERMRQEVQRIRPKEAKAKSEAPSVMRAVLPKEGPPEGKINVHSDTWIFISQQAEAELIKIREANDDMKKDGLKTAALRGEIKRLKWLISLPEPAKERRLPEEEPRRIKLKGYGIR